MAETALHRTYRDRLARIQARTVTLVAGSDTSSTDQFVSRVVPTVLAAQTAVIANTDAYLSAEAGLSTGTSTDPWGLDPAALIGVHARRGDFLEDVYGRNHRAEQSTFDERIKREVTTDLVLAERAATFIHTAGDTRIVGHRRVLSAGKNCALCVAASSRRYAKADLRPLHHTCRCTTQAIYGDVAGWAKPSRATLTQLYEAAGSTSGQSLAKVSTDVAVVDSTLGPTLVSVSA